MSSKLLITALALVLAAAAHARAQPESGEGVVFLQRGTPIDECRAVDVLADYVTRVGETCSLSGVLYDVRGFGAKCDGVTDDRAAIQSAIDTLSASGLEIGISGTCVVGGAGLEIKDGMHVRCHGGGALKADPGITTTNGIFWSTTPGTDFWSIEGCEIDANGVAVPAINFSGDGVGYRIRRNYVHGAPTTGTTPYSHVRFDQAPVGIPAPVFEGNWVVGSGADARNDTCVTAVLLGNLGAANVVIRDNHISSCGETCLEVNGGDAFSGSVVDNVLDFCSNYGIWSSIWNGVIEGNLVHVSSKATHLYALSDNLRISGNNFTDVRGATAVHVVAASGKRRAGLYVVDNYASNGIWLDSQGKCTGGTCGGEPCDDSAGCSGCGGTCGSYGIFDHNDVSHNVVTGKIRAENQTNLVVGHNVVIGQFSRGETSSLEFVNPTSERVNGNILISGNQLSKRDAGRASSTVNAITFDDAGGGGFESVVVTGNGLGGTGPRERQDNGIKLVNSPDPWGATIVGNSFVATDALVGFDTDAALLGTFLGMNSGLDPDDVESVLKALSNRTASLAKWSAVEPASGANDAVRQASAGSKTAIGCSMGPDSPAEGATIRVAVGGYAKCLIDGSETAVTRGDPLKVGSTAGKLVKATPGESIVGYAMETVSADGAGRVLIQPGVRDGGGGTAPVVATYAAEGTPLCTAAFAGARDPFTVKGLQLTGATGGKAAVLSATVVFDDLDEGSESIGATIYDNGSTPCPSDCSDTDPSGTSLWATWPRVDGSGSITVVGVDSATVHGTNHYCLALRNETDGDHLDVLSVHMSAVEYQ